VLCGSCGQPLLLNNRYRCLRVLGQGGFGRTYQALDEGVDPPRPCVVKHLLAVSAASPESQPESQHRRFQLEAQQLRILGQHPQIPDLLGVIDNARGQFLVQQYIPGPTLAQLSQAHPLDESQVRRVLDELLPVLQFVHDHGVVHRDIKPANIIAPPSPQPLVLVDFGASKTMDLRQLDKTGTVIGSAGYGAPEQALGKAVFASDLFSLGVTCLNLLTGLHPFDLYSVSEDAWVWQPFLPKPVSPGLAQVLDRLANRRLKERYSTAQEALTDLRWSAMVAIPDPPADAARPRSPQPAAPTPGWSQRFVIHLERTVANGVAVSPSGRAIAVPCSDGSVGLWDCTNGEPLQRLQKRWGVWGVGHQGSVTSVCFSADGQSLLSAGQDGQIIQWPLTDDGLPQRLPVPGWFTTCLTLVGPTATSPQTLVVGTGDGPIHLWPLVPGASYHTLIHHQAKITAIAVNADRGLVSSSLDQTLRWWSLPTGHLSQTVVVPKPAITALASHPQDGRVVTGDQGGRLQVWNPQQPETPHLVAKLANPVTALGISPNGHWLAAGLDNGQLALWSLPGLRPAPTVGHAWAINGLAFTPDSGLLISTGADGTIRFWGPPPSP
jgi:WD40 repeat protein